VIGNWGEMMESFFLNLRQDRILEESWTEVGLQTTLYSFSETQPL
jgi:hypothetical protein